ncbi:MAG: ABC transporter ATP-binding protein/permease, partial [Gammaproteobacteria bacterium]|nr:ABC transporter ATP-binding protein/permease [Gammaproteobacteria bacterium]MBT4129833.1 ABC transporter ATP-binding protein/permease [Candidatus Neomarinimicrobiota bacterium]MBT5687728.1 ABC transporter ATP-binding protein/permease [Gammaproteobacteria bacterium]
EKMINDALREISTQHTTLVIAHRLSTIADADEILVMEQGKIIERGTHQELLDRKQNYASMWSMQQEKRGPLVE